MPYNLHLYLAHSISSSQMLTPHKHQSPSRFFYHHHETTLGLIFLEWYDPLHIIIWPHWFIDLNLTWCSRLPWSISAKSLLKLPRHMWFVASKPPTCPSHLQSIHRCKALSWSCQSSHKTSCHVSYAMSSFITLYEIASTLSYFSIIAHVAYTSVSFLHNGTCCSY